MCASAGRDASHRPCPAAGAVGQASEVSSAPNHYATLRFAGGFSRSASTSGSRSLGLAHGRTGCFGTTSGQPGWLHGDIPLRRGAGVLPCWCSASENVRCHEKDSAARTCGRWSSRVLLATERSVTMRSICYSSFLFRFYERSDYVVESDSL